MYPIPPRIMNITDPIIIPRFAIIKYYFNKFKFLDFALEKSFDLY
jgi:hypothetical protein